MLKKSFFAIVIILLTAFVANAQVPQLINYQGMLTDSDGNPVNSTLSIQFKIYVNAVVTVGETPLWEEIQSVVVADGIYSVLLGSITPITPAVFDGNIRYLGVTIGDDSEMIPRGALVSVGYAYRAHKANNLEGIHIKNGNVGIGKTDPDEALDVEGNIHSSGIIKSGNSIFINGQQTGPSGDDEIAASSGELAILGNPDTSNIKVSIGKSNPLEKLDVAGTVQMSGFKMPTGAINGHVLTSDANGNGSWAPAGSGGGDNLGDHIATENIKLNGHWLSGDGGDEGVYINNDGNVGIGTTTPVWELEVANLTAGLGAESGVTANDAGGAIAAYSSTLPDPFAHYAGRVSLFSDAATMGLDLRVDGIASDMRFYTGGFAPSNERMRISNTGNVGIGTTNADGGKLVVVEDNDRNVIDIQSTNASGWAAVDFLDSGGNTVGFVGYGNNSVFNYPDKVFLGAVNRGIVLDPGDSYVSIGATYTSGGRLNVYGGLLDGLIAFGGAAGVYGQGDISGLAGWSMNGSGVKGSSTNGFGVSGDSPNGFAGKFFGKVDVTGTLTIGGNVGIGTSPSYKLHVNGTAYATGAAGALSDIRHKKNVRSVSDNALNIMDNLRPIIYEWKSPTDSGMEGTQIGFIAQEVEEILPEVVLTQDDEEQTKGLKYNQFIPLMVKAIQELKTENENGKKNYSALKAENAQLRKALATVVARQGLLEAMFCANSSSPKESLVKFEMEQP